MQAHQFILLVGLVLSSCLLRVANSAFVGPTLHTFFSNRLCFFAKEDNPSLSSSSQVLLNRLSLKLSIGAGDGDDDEGRLNDDSDDPSEPATTNQNQRRRSFLTSTTKSLVATTAAFLSGSVQSQSARAEITNDSLWPLWPALPVAPFARRKTTRTTIVPHQVWTFDQILGIYYVHVPIRMTVVATTSSTNNNNKSNETNQKERGLLVYAPIAPTVECLRLLQELIDDYGPVQSIVLPSVAVEHKVNAGPFARHFPNAAFYAVDRQYSFPISLPNSFLGLPSNLQPLPASSSSSSSNNNNNNRVLGDDIEFQVLTVKPGPGSEYQDVAVYHKSSKTLLVCDALFGTTSEPPAILTSEPEYCRALLFHARNRPDELVPDTPENRRIGWRRIVLLFNFFFPGSGRADLGIGPILEALQNPTYAYGWGGWMPFSWNAESEQRDFETFTAGGKAVVYTIVQIILARGATNVNEWVDIVTAWDFDKVIPAHLDAPLAMGPAEFKETFAFCRTGRNEVRACDEDVEFLRAAEEGPLRFSVYPSSLGPLRGRSGKCGLVRGPVNNKLSE